MSWKGGSVTSKTEERIWGEAIRLYIDIPFSGGERFPGDRLVQLIDAQGGWLDWQITYGTGPDYEDTAFITWG